MLALMIRLGHGHLYEVRGLAGRRHPAHLERLDPLRQRQKLATLQGETGLQSVRLINQQAVQVIQRLQLDIGEFDIPGGTDTDPSDHSVAQ
jgi:hypothetical protein